MDGYSEFGSWYGKTFVQYEICKLLNNKYMSFSFKKGNKWIIFRYLYGFNVEMLQKAFNKMQLDSKLEDLRLYCDLAHWKSMLSFSFNPKERKIQKEVQWTEKIKLQHLSGYDWGFDFEGSTAADWKIAHKHCLRFLGYLDSFGVPYSVCWSGLRGFHVRILDKYLPKWKPISKVSRLYEFAEYIKFKLKLKTLDLMIYQIAPVDRILKLPYTIDGKSGLVVLPLDRAQFSQFNPLLCRPEFVLKHAMIKNRGLVERDGSPENVKKMLKEMF